MSEDALETYLVARAEQRASDVDRTLAAMTARERRLVREAAVMGFVQGCRRGEVPDPYPSDTEVMRYVVDACLAFHDLYPIINSLADGGAA